MAKHWQFGWLFKYHVFYRFQVVINLMVRRQVLLINRKQAIYGIVKSPSSKKCNRQSSHSPGTWCFTSKTYNTLRKQMDTCIFVIQSHPTTFRATRCLYGELGITYYFIFFPFVSTKPFQNSKVAIFGPQSPLFKLCPRWK